MDKSIRAQEIYDRYMQDSDDGRTDESPDDIMRRYPDVGAELRQIFDKEDELNSAVADYMQRLDSGSGPPPEAMLSENPDLQDELRQFFSVSQSISELTEDVLPDESRVLASSQQDAPPWNSAPREVIEKSSSPVETAAEVSEKTPADASNPAPSVEDTSSPEDAGG